jgi:hypothetical protein
LPDVADDERLVCWIADVEVYPAVEVEIRGKEGPPPFVVAQPGIGKPCLHGDVVDLDRLLCGRGSGEAEQDYHQ